MGRNSKYKSTRAVAVARSFNPKINPEYFGTMDVEDNNKLWNSINSTRDEILKKYGSVIENPDSYIPMYPDVGMAGIEDIMEGRVEYIRTSKELKDVMNLLGKTTFGELDKNTGNYADNLDVLQSKILQKLPINKDLDKLYGLGMRNPGFKDLIAPATYSIKSDLIRTPYWDSRDKDSPEYKQFYKGTKNVGDRIVKYVEKRCSVLLPEEQYAKDVFYLQQLQKVMINSINELNNSRLPWNRSYSYSSKNNISNYAKPSELIGADEKVFSKIKSPDINVDILRREYNNSKNAILSEISTQRKIVDMSRNPIKQKVERVGKAFAEQWFNEIANRRFRSNNSSKSISQEVEDSVTELGLYQYGVDDENA